MEHKYDLISIGDTTIDAFVRLHEAAVHCRLDNKECELCISYADKVPYESLELVAAVGNASNLAVGTARLGLKSGAFTAIGGDYFGQQILDVYKKEKVGRELVKVNQNEQTNYHLVLNYKAERTILIKQHHYEYHSFEKVPKVEWIYLSSLAGNNVPIHLRLGKYLKKHKDLKMGFNPATFEMKMGTAKLREIYHHTYVLFVNFEEAQRILQNSPRAKSRGQVVKILFKGLHKLGPKIVVITDGPDGAYASDGNAQYFMPKYPDPKPPFERTGAGDAFSTGFMAALVYGLPVTEALRWAPINSMSVVQYTGAQRGLLKKSGLLRLLKKAPRNYKPQKI